MRIFLVIWFGQMISLLGSGLFGLAVGIWAYQRTGSATLLTLIFLADTLPAVLFAPYAGTVADRVDRRLVMILGDCGAALSTVTVAWLIWTDAPITWVLFAALAFGTISNTFQWPAYHASIALLTPKEQLGRVNGLLQVGQAIATIVPPLLAGVLVTVIGIAGVIMIDFATFLFAIITVLSVRIPMPEPSTEEQEEKRSTWQELFYGWNYIKVRQGLLLLLVVFSIVNFFVFVVDILTLPLILSFTSESVLGTILSLSGVGLLVGGLVMSKWGGPKPRVPGMLLLTIVAGFFLLLQGTMTSAVVIGIGIFCFHFCLPIIGGSNQVIWQTKVALDVQGRVFATKRMVTQIVQAVALTLAGPLADRVFEPLLVQEGSLANSVGRLIGVGQGRGIGLMFILMGSLIILTMLLSYLNPRLRLAEEELPDAIPDQKSDDEKDGQQKSAE
jgi:MFS family permease